MTPRPPRRSPVRGSRGVTPEELEAWFTERGHPAYRARQVLDAAWGGLAAGFAEILTLPAPLRDELEAGVPASTPPPNARCARPTAA